MILETARKHQHREATAFHLSNKSLPKGYVKGHKKMKGANSSSGSTIPDWHKAVDLRGFLATIKALFGLCLSLWPVFTKLNLTERMWTITRSQITHLEVTEKVKTASTSYSENESNQIIF